MNIQTRICYSRKKPRLYKVSGIWIFQSYIDNDVVTEGGTTPELAYKYWLRRARKIQNRNGTR